MISLWQTFTSLRFKSTCLKGKLIICIHPGFLPLAASCQHAQEVSPPPHRIQSFCLGSNAWFRLQFALGSWKVSIALVGGSPRMKQHH